MLTTQREQDALIIASTFISFGGKENAGMEGDNTSFCFYPLYSKQDSLVFNMGKCWLSEVQLIRTLTLLQFVHSNCLCFQGCRLFLILL